MEKTLKSVKVDNDLIEIIDMYTTLMKSISGAASTFTTMVEDGISLYLLQQINMLKIVMQDRIIMENGVLKKMSISEEQMEKINELEAELASYRCKNKMGGIIVGIESAEF